MQLSVFMTSQDPAFNEVLKEIADIPDGSPLKCEMLAYLYTTLAKSAMDRAVRLQAGIEAGQKQRQKPRRTLEVAGEVSLVGRD